MRIPKCPVQKENNLSYIRIPRGKNINSHSLFIKFMEMCILNILFHNKVNGECSLRSPINTLTLQSSDKRILVTYFRVPVSVNFTLSRLLCSLFAKKLALDCGYKIRIAAESILRIIPKYSILFYIQT